MKSFELTDDEYEVLGDAFRDVGNDCPGVDWDKFKALGVKLGIWEAEKPPTEEELKRREEFANSPYMQQMRELMAKSNYLLENIGVANIDILYGTKNIRSILRIKLPNDYQVKDKT